MEPALKQRLLGAVVLIALAIIFVPMLFSGSGPRQDSATVDLEIPPPPSREFETRVLSVDAVTQDPSRQAAQPAAASEPVTAVDTKAPPRVEPLPDEPAAASASAELPTAAAPESSPAKPATPEQVAAGKAAKGEFLVHLGVYASTKNADDLVASLKRGGFPAFSESVDLNGKPALRVRVGPYADRAEAEAARIRIKQLKGDVPSSVVGIATDAKSDAPPSAVPANRPGGWAVQLGAFTTVEDANKLGGRLQAAGFAAYVEEVKADGKTLWRVRAGPEADRGNAEALRGRIKQKLKVDGLVVTQP